MTIQTPTAPVIVRTGRVRGRSRRSARRPRTVVVPTARVAREAKYIPRFQAYLRSLDRPCIQLGLNAANAWSVERARVDFVRVHPVARRADGTPLHRVSPERVIGLLRRGRVLSRDADVLVRALEALETGAAHVRLGTPESLVQNTSTEIHICH